MLFGLLLVAFYLIAHTVTVRVERWRGEPLGGWRGLVFFCVFLALLLTAIELVPRLFGAGTETPA